MKSIHSVTVTAVVLMFALSLFAAPAAAAHDPKDPEHDDLWPDSVFDDKTGVMPGDNVFLKAKKAFDENANAPDSVIKERIVHINGLIDEVSAFDGTDDEELQDGSDPALST